MILWTLIVILYLIALPVYCKITDELLQTKSVIWTITHTKQWLLIIIENILNDEDNLWASDEVEEK